MSGLGIKQRPEGVNRALQIPMPKVMRQAPSIVPIIGELVAGRMPEHVRVHRER